MIVLAQKATLDGFDDLTHFTIDGREENESCKERKMMMVGSEHLYDLLFERSWTDEGRGFVLLLLIMMMIVGSC